MTTADSTVPLKKVAWILGSLFLVSAGITLLFLGMRAVMGIGGACAEGGPFVPIRPCPEGVPLLMIGGIWIGMLAAFAYGWASLGAGVPSFVGLLWPALFMSLGWNFLEYALDPPVGQGPVWGRLIPGIVFELMGVIPLRIMFKAVGLTPSSTRVRPVLAPPGSKRVIDAMRAARTSNPAPPGSDVVSELERLTILHRSGALSDDEFQKANGGCWHDPGPHHLDRPPGPRRGRRDRVRGVARRQRHPVGSPHAASVSARSAPP